jgi:hypothetical protein
MTNQKNAEEKAICAAITLLNGDLAHENAETMRRLLSKLRAPVAHLGLPDVLPEFTSASGAQFVSMGTVQTVLRAARAALASAPVAGEAFMYGVMGPDGKAYLDEFCVSTDPAELEQEVVVPMNEDHGEGKYAVVALFRDAAPQASEAVLQTILHSVRQARIAGNDWRRELALIENTVSAALSAQPGAQKEQSDAE